MNQSAITVLSNSAETTKDLAARLAPALQPGDAVALSGKLGAGKTVFVQGLAQGLGVDPATPVTSPTYVLLHEYQGKLPLYHFDFYRLQSEKDVSGLGFEEYIDGDGITVVEWAGRFPGLFSDSALWVAIAQVDESARSIQISAAEGFDKDRWRRISAVLSSP